MSLLDDLGAAGDRPECEHGLNGPCEVCGPPSPLRALLGEPVPDDLADLGGAA